MQTFWSDFFVMGVDNCYLCTFLDFRCLEYFLHHRYTFGSLKSKSIPFGSFEAIFCFVRRFFFFFKRVQGEEKKKKRGGGERGVEDESIMLLMFYLTL